VFRGQRRAQEAGRDAIAEELERRRRRRADADVAPTAASTDRRPGLPDALVLRDPLDLTPRATQAAAFDGAASVPDELRRGVEPGVLRLLTPQLAHEFQVIPIRVDGSSIVFATAQEPTYKLQNEIRWLVGLSAERQRRPVFVRIPADVLGHCLDIYYPFSQSAALVPADFDLLRLFAGRDGDRATGSAVLRPAGDAPTSVRSLVNAILMKAVYRGANDVLFECFESEFRVRFKVEGECEYAMTPLPPNAGPQVISIVKQHAKLDIAETEKCQDGRFDMKIEYKGEIKSIQFRVAIRPTINGEGCVVRLHDNAERRPRLDALGADRRTLEALHRVRDHRGGLVLFSGPTGSGKTTTLAAILGECDSVRENIVTIEDPVEIRLPGVTQSAVNEAKGETFARLLRNTLRVAPDRILVGEIRDDETAHLVVKAALTGHQVLSTVHSEDAPKAITRVLEEGISPFNLGSVLFLVVAQRLLNRLCDHCSYEVVYPFEVLDREQFSPGEYGEIRAREARGCSMCHHRGTFGRVPIYETLVVTDEIRAIVARRPHDMEALIRREAIREGMRPLRRWGLDLVKQGIVGLAQVADVTPYVPTDALEVVWATVDGAIVTEAGDAEPHIDFDSVEKGSAAGDEHLESIVIRALDDDDDEDSGGVRFAPYHDGLRRDGLDIELLRSMVDHAQADARATISGRVRRDLPED
jgi:type IV pilus assembly protein PilB